jgi:hypothetical protein
MEELKEKFDKLNEELAYQNFTEKEEKEKLDSMREILEQKCKDQNFTAEEDIDSMERQELIELNGKLNSAQGQQNRDEINENARLTQIKQNKYGPDNPYR